MKQLPLILVNFIYVTLLYGIVKLLTQRDVKR